ncbi:ABC transporter permease subunit [Alphaproteobacteria bacterium]|nr:ABC transporter permease subunit [Alphaproteobacteria bacterium]|tara:strand:+ start:2212 stop:3381 length:1170 start_codon:yes stop_codon:yes gene_type:complete
MQQNFLRKLIFDEKTRALLIQTLVIGIFAVLIYLVTKQTAYNLEKRGIGTGFEFLNIAAGYDISISLIPYDSNDTHLRAYFVGLLNTLMIAVCGCFLATILGFLVGIIRLSSNWLFRNIAYVYVEFTRNVPVLLQIILYYTILLHLPKVKQSLVIFDNFYLSNRGLFSPAPIFKDGFSIVIGSLIVMIIFTFFLKRFLKKKQELTGKQYPIFLINSGLIIFTPIFVYYLMGMPLEFDHPVMKGFNFKGGMVIRPEFLGMLFGLSIYTAAFISETVRSGIISVSKGQREASQALGLKSNFIMRLIIIPQALRVIIPPLTSQYLNLTKNSSLGIAIGYADLVHGFGGISLNQTGKAIEIMLIVMSTYLTISLIISFFMNLYNKAVQFKGNV